MTRLETWMEGNFDIQIYYEDTDFSGYVYHANYVKYFERAREELVGIEWLRDLYNKGIHYVVHKIDMTFHSPAKHGDKITLRSKLRLSESPITLCHQTAFLHGTDTKLASGEIKLVAVNNDGEAIRIPKDIVQSFIDRDQTTNR